ncbi:uncharacterized protein (TIGR02611 family) [Halopolyspora algeriensis]|uniref:Uncharacterized protein (TIGR02611 family) n=1 Tax=Halopolyspora algeriensis TaxID=1500506 RepID=A0A368VS38_9ACTN|nr:TIGR02611 family protein [Halopolyspora algeriensis]RCW43935.1 uncharacterized protein (TIGR02611 family) [Halopolyspora algeriensis]TQM53562.1 uncharacterized protein (TIGR02611 family) [Halopolyspora algeriensis]
MPRHPRLHAWRDRLHERRERIRRRPTLNTIYRGALGAVGGIVFLAGILMVPYPGPGWITVFAGLGILGTEFAWAHRVNMFAKHHYHRWMWWVSRQHPFVKLLVMTGTCLVVLVTLWLLGAFALLGEWVGLPWGWLQSPLLEP